MTTICRHIKINGERCGSPALSSHAFCYFHRNLSQRHSKPAPEIPTIIHPVDGREPHAAAPQPSLILPPLEDRESIQFAASIIIGALARNTLDTKRASILLYGLQVASANAARLNHKPSRDYLVIETTLTSSGDEIAPDIDPPGEIAFQQFIADLHLEDPDEEDEEDESQPELSPVTRYLRHTLSNAGTAPTHSIIEP
jgi:hypothetical protein